MFVKYWLSAGSFGSTWSVLGASWAQLGRSWGQLGRLRGQLGRSWGQLATNLSALWVILGALEAILGALGAFSGRSWALLVASGRSKGDLGSNLVPPEKDFGASEGRFRRLRGLIVESLAIVSGISQQRRIMSVESEITTTRQQQRK